MANLTIQSQVSEIYRGAADTLSVKLYSDGVSVTPGLATYALYDSSGIAGTSGSATIATNTLSVAVGAAEFPDVVEEACRCEWTVSVSGARQTFVTLFDVVDYKLFSAVIDADLKVFVPNLADDLWSSQTTFDKQIRQADLEVRRSLHDRGLIPTRVLDPEQIKHLVCIKALEIIFFGFIRSPDDVWDMRYKDFRARYDVALANVRPLYDSDGDGSPDVTIAGFGTITAVR